MAKISCSTVWKPVRIEFRKAHLRASFFFGDNWKFNMCLKYFWKVGFSFFSFFSGLATLGDRWHIAKIEQISKARLYPLAWEKHTQFRCGKIEWNFARRTLSEEVGVSPSDFWFATQSSVRTACCYNRYTHTHIVHCYLQQHVIECKWLKFFLLKWKIKQHWLQNSVSFQMKVEGTKKSSEEKIANKSENQIKSRTFCVKRQTSICWEIRKKMVLQQKAENRNELQANSSRSLQSAPESSACHTYMWYSAHAWLRQPLAAHICCTVERSLYIIIIE